MEIMNRLEKWFYSNCDGDWEHEQGVRISTLDNPGWSLYVQLEGTTLFGVPFETKDISRDENNWILCRLNGVFFEGLGGPNNLKEILEVFLSWAECNTSSVAKT